MNPFQKWRPNRQDRRNLKIEWLNKKSKGEAVACRGKCGKIFHPPYYEGMFLHHVLPVEKFPERFWDVENCIALCNTCHNKVHWALYAYRGASGK